MSDRNKESEPVFLSTEDVAVDVLEWWCHAVLQETVQERNQQRGLDLETAMKAFHASGGVLPKHGRLLNRVQIAAVFVDISRRPINSQDEEEDDDEEEEIDDNDVPLADFEPELWERFKEQLLQIKADLLRRDANSTGDDPPDETIDENLASLAKFSQDCDTVVAWLDLFKAIAHFRQVLEDLEEEDNEKNLLPRLKEAVDDFEESVAKCDLENTGKLTAVLLKDMYKSKTQVLPEQLCQHLKDSLSNEENEFSYARVRYKVLRLLQRWHGCVLTAPKLSKLGYGGFTKRMSVFESRRSSLFDENASVSSWGVDEEELKEKRQVEGAAASRESSANDDTDEYATADEEEVTAAFDLGTQPPEEPIVDASQDDDEVADKEKEPADENEPPKDEDVDDGDKKPSAKSSSSSESEEEDAIPRTRRTLARAAKSKRPLRSSPRLAKTKTKSPRKLSPAKAKTDNVARMPPRKSAARKERDDDESITEPESSPPKQRRQVAARKPKKKPRATVIEWGSSEDEDEVVPTRKRVRRKSASSQQRPKKKQKRRRFTEEEKEAIREGVRRHGHGNWAMIRINSGGVLMSRTGPNIKDCYRTMERRGEV